MDDSSLHTSTPPGEPGEPRRLPSDPRVPGRVPNDADSEWLLHELSVYQVELETQNEQLRQTQLDLESSRASYRALYTEAPVGYLTVGVQGRILNCNRRAAEFLRLTPMTAQRRRITEFMSPETTARYSQLISQLYRTQEPLTLETELRRADGRSFWAELTMNLTRDGGDGHAVTRITISDMSDRKRMQDDTARLVAIVASSDQAIISQNLDGTITTWNAGAERLFGYQTSEALGHSIDMIVPDDRLGEESSIRSRIRSRIAVADDTVRLRKDGTPVHVFVSAAPILDPQGRVTGISHIVRDISEQVEAREKVARLLENMREADRRKDDFIATLAHELRNPLAPIRNAATVMRYVKDLDPKLQWCRDVIDRQVGHMAALLEDLLDVSRLTRDKITLRRDRVELGTAIAQAVELNRHVIESRGHTLSLQLTPEPIEIEGDLTRLTQVFGNLLNNAAKYTDANGEITVTTAVSGEQAIVRVKDTGIGIRPEYLGSIFDLFTQVDPAREGPEGGLGIGLALVKGLVERHGGTITVDSEGLGHGSEFTVTLPKGRTPERLHTGDHPIIGKRRSERSSRRVLVVDDNVDAADSMAMILQVGGHEVRVAHDGIAALEVGAQFRPEAMLLDIGMPRMSGYELAERVRQAPWDTAITLIACTGWGQSEDRRKSQEAGFDHHLVKPVSARVILQIVNAVQPAERG